MKFKFISISFIIVAFVTLLASCNDDDTSNNSYAYYRTLTAPIVASMTLQQKLGQMTLPKYSFLISDDETYLDYSQINQYGIGAMLVAAGEVPDGDILDALMLDPDAYLTATKENWAPLITGTNNNAPSVTLSDGQTLTIPLLTGVDAVHGFHEVLGNVIFPHNIGLSMTNDTELLTNIGKIVANDLLQLGFNWTYAPTVAIKHNPNWGRTFETQGSVPEKVRINTEAMINGLQQFNQGMFPETGVLATVKHFIGDGATQFGIDEGNTLFLDEDRFVDVNAQGYVGAIDANVGSLMVSYSAINSIPMSIEDDLKARLLDGSLLGDAFTGFIVSDYGAAANIADRGLPSSSIILPYKDALASSINTGIDMIMITNARNTDANDYYKTIPEFLTIFEEAVTEGLISESRIDEAVNNILAVKYAMGLISIDSDGNWSHQFKMLDTDNYTQDEKITVAQTAAEKSLVLLKNNDNLLPIDTSKIEYVVFVGDVQIDQRTDSGVNQLNIYQNYHNIGAQAGGWVISWQGIHGNLFWEDDTYKASSGAVSIREGIEAALPNATLLYPNYGDSSATTTDDITAAQTLFTGTTLVAQSTSMTAENTLIIGVIAENPTAEFMGDSSVFYCEEGLDYTQGCLYSFLFNAYVHEEQDKSLSIDYQAFDSTVINQVQSYDTSDTIPLISILISGRDRIIDADGSSALSSSDAFIAAWLPGPTGGTALANAITGEYLFCGGVSDDGTYCNEDSANTLSIDWVATDESLDNYPVYTEGSGFVAFDDPLYEIGYGLPTFAPSE